MIFIKNEEETSETDGTTNAWKWAVTEVGGEIIVATTTTNRADIFIFWQNELKDGTCVVVKPADNPHVGGNLVAKP